MNMLFASDRERELHYLKQKRMRHVLTYNLQEMERKRKTKEEEYQTIRNNSQLLNEQALNSLMYEQKRRDSRMIEQRNMLRETYERQMKERDEKAKMEKIMDRQYFYRQQEHMDFEQSRRMLDIARIYNRATYQAIPIQGHRRIKTEPKEIEEDRYRTKPVSTTPMAVHQPATLEMKPSTSSAERGRNRQWNYGEQGIKDSLDNLNAESIRYPRNDSIKNVHNQQ